MIIIVLENISFYVTPDTVPLAFNNKILRDYTKISLLVPGENIAC